MTRPIPIRRNDPGVKDERVSYIGLYNSVPFIQDESPFHLHMTKSRSWLRRGTTTNPIIGTSRGPNVTMIIATSSINIVYCEAIYTTNRHGQLTIHHVNQEFYDSYEYRVKYLPQYSPFMNQRDEVFSQLKNSVRRNGPINGNVELTQRMIAA
ncbi:hypothetical protein RF11_04658 [Thelohanellus kitauei]|uniref:Tc1-like transposase DDE domain-containing protein n=1 Tax=Thelohanellus kitauei TaxID=669202 RepID=A0A0C2JXW7_THEKT|nr:hypothetical protein RF11_04658 [Thelohanellus kitauei]